MIRPIILTIVFSVYHASALKCHVVPIGNLSLPDTSPLQECPLGSRSCIKVVDYERGTYTKQCQISNCPMNGRPNSDDNCQNGSSFGAKWSTCCCYEDGCNSDHFVKPANNVSLSSLFSFVINIFYRLFFFL